MPAPRRPHEPKVLLSLVVPVFNEAGVIDAFLQRALPVMDAITRPLHGSTFEIIFVDDGSTDAGLAEIEAARAADPRIKAVSLSRNFGKDAALTAGLREARGAAVIPMDVDLQDPPEVIPQMVQTWLGGVDVVVARRVDRASDTWLKRTTAGAFYRVFNRLADRPITPNAGDFRLLSRAVVDALNALPERARFMKGLFDWVGFTHATVDYTREARSAGTSKWRYWRLWNFALDGLTGSSTAPLRVWTYVGAAASLFAFAYAALLIVRTLVSGVDVPGYASLMVVVLLFGGLNLLSLGIIGEYLGRTYMEVKQRPLYVVRRSLGLDDAAAAELDDEPEAGPGARTEPGPRRAVGGPR